MKSGKIFILKQLSSKATLKEKILIYILKDYTYKIYMKGLKKALTGITNIDKIIKILYNKLRIDVFTFYPQEN